MEHFVFYRKYRPNSFKEVQGQEFIIKTLQNSIINNNLSHTYIFSGPRGTGKTSIAKIFAKSLNCLSPKNGDCCNECNNCLLINKNEEVDIIEIDAASNNGVGEIRNIIENISYLPMLLKNKVYIIDEAHMLTSFAWNAFLKTLEDPPKHLIFIFATTEPHKIPATIISRCQRYNFLKISSSNLISYIKTISELERINIDEPSINKIVSLADGSLRDALSILDQLSTFTSKNIKIEDVNKVFGLLDLSLKLNLIEDIVFFNMDKIINNIEYLDQSGIDLYQLCIDIIEIILEKIIYEKTKELKFLKTIPISHINFIEVQPKILFKFINIWEDAMLQIKNHSNSKFFFELACLNSSRLFNFDDANNSTTAIKENNYLTTNVPIPMKNDLIKSTIINNLIKSNETQNNVNIDNVSSRKNTNINISKSNDDIKKYNNDLVNMQSYNKSDLYKNVDPPNISINKEKDELDNIIKNALKVKSVNLLESDFSEFRNLSGESFNKIKDERINSDFVLKQINNKNQAINDINNQTEKVIDSKLKINLVTSEKINILPQAAPLKKEKAMKYEKDEEETLFSISDNGGAPNLFIKPKVIDEVKKDNLDDIDFDVYSLIFNQIAFNKNNIEKERLNNILMHIKNNVPISPEEGYFVDSLKVIIASNNGFVVLFDDDISVKNLNLESNRPNFINYVKSKFGHVFKVLAVNKNMVINFTHKYKEMVSKQTKLNDVDIQHLFEMPAIKETLNKDVAIEILGDLIKED